MGIDRNTDIALQKVLESNHFRYDYYELDELIRRLDIRIEKDVSENKREIINEMKNIQEGL